jgi:membrane-anchored mycosin MYCP
VSRPEFSPRSGRAAEAGTPRLGAVGRRAVLTTLALVIGLFPVGLPGRGLPAAEAAPPPAPLTTEATGCDRLLPSRWRPAAGWAQERLDFADAARYSTGKGVRAAVVDTGVSRANRQLTDAVVGGRSFVSEDSVAATVDCDGHGTLAAGIIAARPVAGSGLVGIAPDAAILAYRYAAGGDKGSRAEAMARAIVAAVDDGAAVVNVSSVTVSNLNDLRDAVAYAEDHDVLIVAAAGNSGDGADEITYPARYPGVMAVAAVDANGAWWNKSQTSLPISVAAPGVGVLGSAPIAGNALGDGTSFAAPYVSGLAALVRSKYPDLTAQDVKRRIEATADVPPGHVPDPKLGYGTINPERALTEVLASESAATTGPAASTPLAAVAMAPLPLPVGRPTRVRDRSVALALSMIGLALLGAAVTMAVRRTRVRG